MQASRCRRRTRTCFETRSKIVSLDIVDKASGSMADVLQVLTSVTMTMQRQPLEPTIAASGLEQAVVRVERQVQILLKSLRRTVSTHNPEDWAHTCALLVQLSTPPHIHWLKIVRKQEHIASVKQQLFSQRPPDGNKQKLSYGGKATAFPSLMIIRLASITLL